MRCSPPPVPVPAIRCPGLSSRRWQDMSHAPDIGQLRGPRRSQSKAGTKVRQRRNSDKASMKRPGCQEVQQRNRVSYPWVLCPSSYTGSILARNDAFLLEFFALFGVILKSAVDDADGQIPYKETVGNHQGKNKKAHVRKISSSPGRSEQR